MILKTNSIEMKDNHSKSTVNINKFQDQIIDIQQNKL